MVTEECAYQMLAGGSYDDSGHTGISILVKSYRSHCDNAKVVEVLMVLMYELSKYGEFVKSNLCAIRNNIWSYFYAFCNLLSKY